MVEVENEKEVSFFKDYELVSLMSECHILVAAAEPVETVFKFIHGFVEVL